MGPAILIHAVGSHHIGTGDQLQLWLHLRDLLGSDLLVSSLQISFDPSGDHHHCQFGTFDCTFGPWDRTFSAEATARISCMSARPSATAVLDQVIAALSALRLRVAGSAGDEFELVSAAGSEGPTSTVPDSPRDWEVASQVWSLAWDRTLFAATTPEGILAVDLSPVRPLEPSSRLTAARNWSPLARLGVALRAGRRAHHILVGTHPIDLGEPIGLPVRAKYSIVLRCERSPVPFWTTNTRTYLDRVGDIEGRGQVDPGVVAFSCASKAEATAFLLGAGVAWPQQLP